MFVSEGAFYLFVLAQEGKILLNPTEGGFLKRCAKKWGFDIFLYSDGKHIGVFIHAHAFLKHE